MPERPPLQGSDFERAYAERSDVTVEWLHEQGMHARPCSCDYEGCEGWQMVRSEAPDAS